MRVWHAIDRLVDRYLRTAGFFLAVVIAATLVAQLTERINSNEDNLVRAVCLQNRFLESVRDREVILASDGGSIVAQREHARAAAEINSLVRAIAREIDCPTGGRIVVPEVGG
jgi:hypothetical protein